MSDTDTKVMEERINQIPKVFGGKQFFENLRETREKYFQSLVVHDVNMMCSVLSYYMQSCKGQIQRVAEVDALLLELRKINKVYRSCITQSRRTENNKYDRRVVMEKFAHHVNDEIFGKFEPMTSQLWLELKDEGSLSVKDERKLSREDKIKLIVKRMRGGN